MPRVHHKIALITGSARGIGATTARLLAQEGATVIITDILDEEGEALAASIGDSAVYYSLDACDEETWKGLAEMIRKKYGRLDILFNNAGIIGFGEGLGPQDPEQASLESWRYIHHVNLDSVFLGCKYGIGLMKGGQQGGSIVNMSSRSGLAWVFPLRQPMRQVRLRFVIIRKVLLCIVRKRSIIFVVILCIPGRFSPLFGIRCLAMMRKRAKRQ